ncbi:MAG: cyclopropane fatty acyl phospholipid synthase [Desulfobacterales bacterium]|nr:cyclopropane fatty acyl phospholipid synthase [Desulfobacterales bacterium]
MPGDRFRRKVESLLAAADIRINGDRPWDLAVHNEKLFPAILTSASLGFGNGYADGWWDCERLDEAVTRSLRAGLDRRMGNLGEILLILKARFCNLQKWGRAFQVGRYHYDLSNRLYRAMLDKRMIYSCGYWQRATTLDEAQEAKLDLVCRKLDLRPGMRVLDIGCGWGGAAKFAVERHGVEVVGITVSREQERLARKLCQGLPVEIRLMDYRDLSGRFDRIFSLGMFEHVGYKNYRTFMRTVRRCLKRDGLFLLHTIGGNVSETHIDPWIDRCIFPNAMIPSARQICQALEGLFVIEDWHSFGADYDKTLVQWFRNFDGNWETLRKDYDDHFYRTWKYYLLSCAGSFRARRNQLWQIVLSPEGIPGGYHSVR